MDPFELALLIGAAITAAVSISDRRALLWIAIGAANFAITTTWARQGHPPPPTAFVTGVFDAGMCLLIITFGRHRWERALGFVVQFMVLVSFARVAGMLNDRFLYVVTLELANWAALFVIGGTHIARRIDESLGRMGLGSPARRAVRYVAARAFAERTSRPFWAPR